MDYLTDSAWEHTHFAVSQAVAYLYVFIYYNHQYFDTCLSNMQPYRASNVLVMVKFNKF